MCGIVGIYHLQCEITPSQAILKKMADTIVYRGPDDEGYHIDKGLGFGFRRLSIIDLGGGHQPISNEDSTVMLICNGEIYNYKELRRNLQLDGHLFKTDCDIEVLVHLYEEVGENLLKALNGQFAFAIFDQKRERLLLGRDHVGIAPLFYTVADNTLIFASEIKAILQHPAVQREVDLTGLDQMLTFPGLISPRTMFKNIHALKPGHYLLVEDGKLSVREYWDLSYPTSDQINYQLSETDALELLDEQLRKAVNYRLNADVPVGFYLSGGLDSSLIASLIHTLSPGEHRHSFSIGFAQQEIDERRYQRMMVEQVKSQHHETVFDWRAISERLPAIIYHAESPLKESYNTCSLALSQLVHQHDIRVVLTGEGADELFAGYVGYRFDQQRQNEEESTDLDELLAQELQEKLWGDGQFFYEKNYHGFKETKTALYSQALVDQFDQFDCIQRPLVDKSKLLGRHALHKRSYLDFKFRLSDHLLADHGDRVAYANSVEARYPFLDVNVIAAAQKLPPNLLLNGMIEKYILKQLSARYLPEAVIKREKFSFVAPGSPYLLQQNVSWINELLSRERIKRDGYFNPDTVERLKKIYGMPGFTLSQTFDDDLLMMVLTFNIFLDTFHLPRIG